MIVYSSDTDAFIEHVRDNTISDMMSDAFEGIFGRKVGGSEIMSWQNSLSRVRDLIELAGLTDNMIALEYEVPYNQHRIDCLLFGKGDDNAHNVVLIELKQWSSVKSLEDAGNFVETYTGGAERVVPHPAQQVEGYHHYLKGFTPGRRSLVYAVIIHGLGGEEHWRMEGNVTRQKLVTTCHRPGGIQGYPW